jgi:hypothetical protein
MPKTFKNILVLALLGILFSGCFNSGSDQEALEGYDQFVIDPFDRSNDGFGPPPIGPPPGGGTPFVPGPVLAVNVGSLDFGLTATMLAFQVWNDGGQTLNFSLSENAAWLSLSATNGSSTGDQDRVVIDATVDRSGLANGTHQVTLTVTPSSGPSVNVPVSVTVGNGVVVAITASRISGSTPLAVDFNVNDQFAWADLENLEFQWNFGDGHVFKGFLAANVFELNETDANTVYTVNLSVLQGGVAIGSGQINITVNAFSGTTICHSLSGSFTDCPAGGIQETDFVTAWGQITPNSRFLFHRGETYNFPGRLDSFVAGPVTVGAYGSGTKPHLIVANNTDDRFFAASQNDWRFVDLEISEPAPQKTIFNIEGDHVLVLRNDLHDVQAAFISDGAGFGFSMHKFIAGMNLTNGQNTNYLAGTNITVINSSLERVGADLHTLQIGGGQNVLIANNRLLAATDQTSLTIQGENDPANLNRAGSDHVLISGNFFSWAAASVPQSDFASENLQYIIWEKNSFGHNFGSLSVQNGIRLNGHDMTVRNNLFFNYRRAVTIQTHNTTGSSTHINVYGNTVYNTYEPNRDHHLVSVQVGSSNIAVKNNFIHAVGSTGASKTLIGDLTLVDASNNIGNFPNNPGECMNIQGLLGSQNCIATILNGSSLEPLFQSIDPNSANFLKPLFNLQNPLLDSGVDLPLFEDFSGTSRPRDGDASGGAQQDIGALEL